MNRRRFAQPLTLHMQYDVLSPELVSMLASLSIDLGMIEERKLVFHAEAQDLVLAETDASGRMHLLTPPAARAWAGLKRAADRDGVVLEIVSAFRGLDEQATIIREKIGRAMPMAKILSLSAPPGFSEHHTGRAVDINTPGCIAREEVFDQTEAFRWLEMHAGRYGFALSYPRENASGFIYEPWHWLFSAA